MNRVRVNSSILAAVEGKDSSTAALVGQEGTVLEFFDNKFWMVELDNGITFPFKTHELTEVK